MKPLVIRREEAGDVAAIRALTADAFRGAAHSDDTEHRVIDALRASGELPVSLVAELDGEVAGHVAFSPVSIPDGTAWWYGLGPLAVLPLRQSAGIGSALVRRGLDELRSLGAAGCVVLGDPAFYTRFGFAHDAALTFDGAPAEYFLALNFERVDGARPRGPVSYSRAFFVAKPGG